MIEDNNTEYINFIKDKNSLFYTPERNLESTDSRFKISKFNSQKWNHYSNLYWSYMIGPQKMPDQGWKIHLTANLDDAQSELTTVSKFLIKKQVSFKFIPTREELVLRNSKYASRVESGKFITIYPSSEREFTELLPILEKITVTAKEGPYILNDMQWHNSNVFFRYGAFKKMETSIDGRRVMAIKKPDGTFVEDRRVPYFFLPDFVTLPPEIQDNEQSPDSHTFDRLKRYSISEALHYSNAGGVYLATKDQHQFILKEGRPYAGIDAEGLDGFSRVKKEYEVLQKLNAVPEIVHTHEYFKAWKHNYLCEDYITGESLVDYIIHNYPFQDGSSDYIKSIKTIINKLVDALNRIHHLGIALGDLQPANIMVVNGKDRQVSIRIIDLESAHKVTDKYLPGLATPGYVNLCSSNYESADWFALYRISRYAFLPIETGTDLAPSIEGEQDKNIEEHFGHEVIDFMFKIKNICFQHINNAYRPPYYKIALEKPQNTFSMDSLHANIVDLSRGIKKNLDYNSVGLIKGDIQQYNSTISQLSIANGAFGGIMGLERANTLTQSEKEKIILWIKKSLHVIELLETDESIDKGLYTGLSGLAAPLFELGFEDVAENLLRKTNFDINSTDVSIYSGISGIGLANIAMYKKISDVDFLQRARKIGNKISELFDGDTSNSGFLDGWLGAAYFLWILSSETGDLTFESRSKEILDTVVRKEIVKTKQGTYLKDDSNGYSKLMPYLNSGSAGLGYLLLKMRKVDPKFIDNQYDDLINELIKTTNVFITYMDSLCDGMSGLMVFDQLANMGITKNKGNLPLKVRSLNNYIIGRGNEALMPGKFGYKCSMDVSSGAAGLLLVMNDIYRDTYESWLPILKDK